MENLSNLFFNDTRGNGKCLADSTAAPAADGDKSRDSELWPDVNSDSHLCE